MTTKTNEIVLKEFAGKTYNGCKYYFQSDKFAPSKISTKSSFISLKQVFKNVFLPENFPFSVSDDYISYQIWDTLQAFCSSISGALAARAMFESIGVGDENATAYGATLTWLIKDGTGMAGRILFAWYQGSSLDSNSKMWRLYADILNDFSFFVDLLTPMLPKHFSIYFLSFSGLLRSIVGIAGGATRSALTQHQAKSNNLADVSAKDSSQETLVNLIALIFNLVLLSYVKDSKLLIWTLFILFTIGHLFSNFKAVKSVIIRTFNRNRLHLVCDEYFRSGSYGMLAPVICNKKEPVLFTVDRFFTHLNLGASISTFRKVDSSMLERFMHEKYFIKFDIRKKSAEILLSEESDENCYLKVLFQIEIVEFVIRESTVNINSDYPDFVKLKKAILCHDLSTVETESFLLASKELNSFVEKAKSADWSFEYTQFSPGLYRYSLDKSDKFY